MPPSHRSVVAAGGHQCADARDATRHPGQTASHPARRHENLASAHGRRAKEAGDEPGCADSGCNRGAIGDNESVSNPPTDDAADRGPAEYAETRTLAATTEAIRVLPDGAPPSLQASPEWWAARPAGARLVGLVVSRDDMPSIVAQRDALSHFGVPIEGFRHPAPETGESWQERLSRMFGHLSEGDVVVVANVHALGRDADEETRTIAELRRRSVIVKVLGSRAS